MLIEPKHISIGDTVKFYDCDSAEKDRDYSGTNDKYYPSGKVIKRYTTNKIYLSISGITLGGDDVVDIELPDGRISKAHFTSGVIKQSL